MNGFDDQADGAALAQYRGIPNQPHTRDEKTRWRRFLEWAMPWLRQKWAMGEAVLQAKAVQEVATARRMVAEAQSAEVRAAQDMMQILAAARQMEQEKLAKGGFPASSPADLEEEIQALRTKIDVLRWKYGAHIRIDADWDKGSVDAEGQLEKMAEDLVRSLMAPRPAKD